MTAGTAVVADLLPQRLIRLHGWVRGEGPRLYAGPAMRAGRTLGGYRSRDTSRQQRATPSMRISIIEL
jgi:hypothetical protein